MADKPKPTHGLLQFYLGDRQHSLQLTDPMLRDVLVALAPYQHVNARGEERTKSRSLGRRESLTAYRLHEEGMTLEQLAVRFECSKTAVQSACRRVRNGRYGEV